MTEKGFKLSDGEVKKIRPVVKKLEMLASMTWGEITNTNRKGSGPNKPLISLLFPLHNK